MGKKILSAILSLAMLASGMSAMGMTAAAEESTSNDYGLAEKTSEGVILHAFNWSYNTIKENLPAIAEAGYTTVQTSPVQQPKNRSDSKDTAGQWWKLYQPLSFSIANQTWLGTKEDLTALCAEADNYGIKIICDIVSNHMANNESGDPYTYYEGIAEYEPEIYANTDKYFHQLKKKVDDSNVEYIVQGTLDGVPDLNTGEPYVQGRVISLLEECIDCGVDGFRFDAAKHIETPADGEFASDFWPNVINTATDYAKDKGVDLFCYGEILNTPGGGRSITDYTKYLNITDNVTGDATLVNVVKKNAAKVVKAQAYHYDDAHSNYVLWAESHDTYMGESGSAGLSNTADVSDDDIARAWAVIASRSESQALYFARPNVIMGLAGNSSWKNTVVTEINRFHNKFIGVADDIYDVEDIVAVQRSDSGIVLVNLGTSSDITAATHGMKDGKYIDAVTGSTFTVSDGTITGTIGSSGVAVVYADAETTPRTIFSKEDTSFKTNTFNVTLTLENAASGTYSVNSSTPVEFTDSVTVTIGEDAQPGDVITITATATDGKKTTTESHKYTKEAGSGTGVFVYFDNNSRNFKNVCVYAFYERFDDDGNLTDSFANASWPGLVMDYDEEKDLYFYELPPQLEVGEARVIFSDGGANQTSQKGHLVEYDSMIYRDNKWKRYLPNGVVLVYGDVNNDGKIQSKDALLVLRNSISLEKFTDEQIAQADVDLNGKVQSKDALAILQYTLSLGSNELIGTEFVFGAEGSDTDDTDSDIPRTGKIFYAVDDCGWIFSYGAKLWLVNNDTNAALEMTKESPTDDNSKYSYIDMPKGWTNLSIYRTDPYDADITKAYNKWNCGTITDAYNAYRMTGDGKGEYYVYDPNATAAVMPRTIYFDNSQTQWEHVYIHGWGASGLNNAFIELEPVAGADNIFTFTFDDDIETGTACFLFTAGQDIMSRKGNSTINSAGEEGKDFYVPTDWNADKKWMYEWKVYSNS
ncbi:MAG: starch-binding protein [Clostridia bacterium]|nr:starch-binding protein [Clostridia bacterium]